MNAFLIAALKPIARLCLGRGIKVQQFFDAAKHAFIAAAEEEVERLETKPSVSRIAAMTGLQRKEIKRLQDSGAYENSSVAHFLLRVLGLWSQDRTYRDPQTGSPRPLSLAPEKNEFAQLVASVSTDLSPYTALFELERLGAIKKGEGKVYLLSASLQISNDAQEGLRLLSEDIAYLVSCVSQNIDSRSTVPNLHARTQYDNISPNATEEIRRWLLERGASFHAEVRAYLSRFDRDLNPALDTSPRRVTVTVGAFSDVEEQMPVAKEKRKSS